MKKINWKQVGAGLTSTLTLLAALPYSLGDIATVIPSEWKSKIVTAGLVATLALRFWNAATTHSPQPPQPQPQPESTP